MYDDKCEPIGIKKAKKRRRKRRRKFPFFVLDMEQVDASTTHYYYNNLMKVLPPSIFLSFSFLFALISMCMYRPLYTHIHYRSRKKIIDSKQLCSMCVHIHIYIYIKHRFLSIIISRVSAIVGS
jgi:hypothetical protein